MKYDPELQRLLTEELEIEKQNARRKSMSFTTSEIDDFNEVLKALATRAIEIRSAKHLRSISDVLELTYQLPRY